MSSNSSSQFRITGYGVGSPKIGLAPPPIVADRAPTTNDYRFPIGQEWIYQISAGNDEVYFLGDVQANIATWILAATSVAGILTITGNTGGAVPADGNNNINVVGAGNIAVTGDIGTNTLTITNADGFVQQVRQQIQGTTSTTSFIADGSMAPTNTDGDEIFSVSITPVSSSNVLLFECNICANSDTAGAFIALFKNSDVACLGSGAVAADGNFTFRYSATAGTTAPTTYSIRFGGVNPAGTTTLNSPSFITDISLGNTISSVFTVTEYSS